jgi:hypothetical protein
MNSGTWIPVIAILSTFAVPIVAIVMDFRRRKLQYEERRAMIERGMTPPPLEEEQSFMSRKAERGENSLRAGIIMLCLGVGLAVAAVLLGYVITDTFIPRKAIGPMTVGASVIGFIGLGNLVYYAVAGKRHATGGRVD